MGIRTNIQNKIKSYFETPFKVNDLRNVPNLDTSPQLTFANTGGKGDFCFLFVDMRASSQLVNKYGMEKAAIIYESFHEIGVRIIQAKGGNIRSFDGDRVMGVFAGTNKENDAVEAAFHIAHTIKYDLNPKLGNLPPVRYGIGIETGETLVVKVGKGRDSNTQDLVWLGEPCNFASHYSDVADNSIIISINVYNKLNRSNKVINTDYHIWTDELLPSKKGINNKFIKSSNHTEDYSNL